MKQDAIIPIRDSGPPVSTSHRPQLRHLGALLGGTALAVYGLSRRSLAGALMASSGGALAYYAYRADSKPQSLEAQGSVLLNCSVAEAFQFWRSFENLPRFMANLESVTVTDEKHSQWTIRGPLGKPITLNSEIVEQRDNEYIAWRTLPTSNAKKGSLRSPSLPGPEVEAKGIVKFHEAPHGRGTVLEARIRYWLPGGALGRAAAKALGKDPDFMMRQDLRRMKALLETGEIPTTEGQPHGPRTLFTGVARVIDPDQPVRRDVGLRQAIEEQRRAS